MVHCDYSKKGMEYPYLLWYYIFYGIIVVRIDEWEEYQPEKDVV